MSTLPTPKGADAQHTHVRSRGMPIRSGWGALPNCVEGKLFYYKYLHIVARKLWFALLFMTLNIRAHLSRAV
jgi:hypothetical protein